MTAKLPHITLLDRFLELFGLYRRKIVIAYYSLGYQKGYRVWRPSDD